MITKRLIQEEIENVADEHLPVLYRIVRALEDMAVAPPAAELQLPHGNGNRWHDFIAETYGCMADAPLERSEEGELEVREDLV